MSYNIHDAVELMIAKDMRASGFAAGFFDPETGGDFARNQALKDAFNAHARIVAIETVGLILGLSATEMWTQYQEQKRAKAQGGPA